MLLYGVVARNQSSTSKKEDADVKLMKCLPSDTTVPSSKAANVQSKSGKPRKLYPCIYCKNVFTQVGPNFPFLLYDSLKVLGYDSVSVHHSLSVHNSLLVHHPLSVHHSVSVHHSLSVHNSL